MQAGQLRREKLVLFLSRRIAVDPPAASSEDTLTAHYQRILTLYREAFDQHGRPIFMARLPPIERDLPDRFKPERFLERRFSAFENVNRSRVS
jgi:hypothetical protein